ncbi:histone H3-lysine(4) N-trimethyltransferase ATX1-like [Amaranthus tricolor]|uniref:histone H3-lysine(4) N-trimethyltransferase ATX1-like n=1 Tax=Amaranthus tricolor TaxID=29722 RepID=UPI002590E77F|nr:histone H3-lysine(4) N-trimethyltransferase ATX1-like [Amaranthus tricolor]XP_057540934.1 histone H3-lysine(4) N-trimethyltransferase ATX1-like [Amaranthus tricolor]
MAFSASQTLIEEENCHEQHNHHQQIPDSRKLVSAEDIDSHYAGTPIRFLPLHHVYSATSPCVSASGSSNVVSKKVQARKLTLIETSFDDHNHNLRIQKEEVENKVAVEPQCNMEPLSDSPRVIRVYSRRRKNKHAVNLNAQEKPILVKEEPVEEEGFVGDASLASPNKRRRISKFELLSLGVDSSVLCRLNGPRLRESRFHYNQKTTTKSSVKKKQQNSSVKRKTQDDWQADKWFLLFFEDADPIKFIGLKCQIYWPLDDVWYKGSISGYDSDSKKHNVKYEDGDAEELILSQEQIRFRISGEEMQKLNLKGKECMDDDDPDYSQLIGLAASVDESREHEPGDIIWAKLTGHAMWPAVILDESLVSDRKGLNKCSGRRSVPVQFFGTHDFARVQVKQIVSFVKGLLSCFHLKCKSSRFLRGLKEAKTYLNEQKLPRSMENMQCESKDVQIVDLDETLKKDDDVPNSRGRFKPSSNKSLFEGLQKLPNGSLPIKINWRDLDRCNVCHMDEEYENNLFLQCDKCRMMVHARCYGEESVDGGLWLCNLCRVGAPEFTPPCRLCPVLGGAMKPTTDGHWAHLACAIWIPETCLADIKKMEPIDGISRINKDRWKLLCSICGIPYGACIQCSNNNCYVAYHPLCARVAGLCVELEDEDRLHLIPVDEDEEDQCIRLLSFCKRHKQPSKDRPIVDEKNENSFCEDLSYTPPNNDSGCARCEPYDYSARRGRKEPEVLAASSAKRLFLENRPHLLGGFYPHDSVVRKSVEDNTCNGSKLYSGIQTGSLNQEALPSIHSMADKYRYMRNTFRRRLAFGKSKIHGFGIFAKLPHKAGDMVIEYTGELVRQPVADRRERLIYNSLVGAGTYMFRIDDERVIDATRAGSIAHLINHSCEPNCYSRVITVCGDEHIMIFAKRDIKQWEELTYDYRFFSIDVELSCSCGAKRCRGVVNDTEAEEQAAKLHVNRSELIDWKGE